MATPEQTPKTANIGMIGLAVMGENLARNIERNGYTVAVYNRPPSKEEPNRVETFMKENGAGKFIGTHTPEEFVKSLERPRKIILLVKAGDPVDWTIDQIKPFLEAGDIIIDGGNSYFKDTERREKALKAEGFNFIGSGVSGGEKGALWGPSLMPGGDREAYEQIRPIWEAIAAKVDDGPCVTYIGPGGAGHFVKMVHNGIEYGDMQLIAESYDIMRKVLGMSADEMAEVFDEWNRGELEVFLIEITAQILKVKDPETGKPLVDLVLDKAGQKGTGKWTSAVALDLGVPIPTINAAVDSRILSARKDERVDVEQAAARPAGLQVRRRPQGDDRGRARRALRVEDLQLRAGHEPHPRRLRELEVGHQPRRDGAHLEGRLHHPRALPRQDQGSVRRGAKTCRISCSILSSTHTSRARRPTGGGSSRRPRRLASPSRPSRPRSATSTRTARPTSRSTSRRRSATSSARTPTSAPTAPTRASSTRSGRSCWRGRVSKG